MLALLSGGCASLNLKNPSFSNFVEKPLESRLAFGRLCERRNEDDKARRIYEGILSSDAENPTALHRLAVMATKQGQFAQAASFFQRALVAQTPSAELINDYGYFYYLQDQLPEAEQQFRKAVEIKPDFKPAWTNLGLALGQQEQFEESRAAFQKAADSPAEVHCSMAYVYAQLRQLDKAQAEYSAALNIDPTMRAAAEGLLQVSAQMPGHEPVTIVSTTGYKNKAKDAEDSQSGDDPADARFGGPTPANSLSPPPAPLANNSQDRDAFLQPAGTVQRSPPGGRLDLSADRPPLD